MALASSAADTTQLCTCASTAGFEAVLGSGGFGRILLHSSGHRVLKVFYDARDSEAVLREHACLELAWAALSAASTHHCAQLTCTRPLAVATEWTVLQGQEYLCGIEMVRVEAALQGVRNGIVHAVLAEGEGVNREVGRVTAAPVSAADNPSRGFFASAEYIRDTLLPALSAEQRGAVRGLDDVALRVGFALSTLVCVAGLLPLDVEYTLGMVDGLLQVVVMDFGMAERIDWAQPDEAIVRDLLLGRGVAMGLDGDIYIPGPGAPAWDAFARGVSAGAAAAGGERGQRIMSSVLQALASG